MTSPEPHEMTIEFRSDGRNLVASWEREPWDTVIGGAAVLPSLAWQRRIVACVNALKDVKVEDIESSAAVFRAAPVLFIACDLAVHLLEGATWHADQSIRDGQVAPTLEMLNRALKLASVPAAASTEVNRG